MTAQRNYSPFPLTKEEQKPGAGGVSLSYGHVMEVSPGVAVIDATGPADLFFAKDEVSGFHVLTDDPEVGVAKVVVFPTHMQIMGG